MSTSQGDQVPHTTAAVAASATSNANNSEHHHHDDEDASEVVETGGTKGERGKFLPRVKVLLSKDNEEVRRSSTYKTGFDHWAMTRPCCSNPSLFLCDRIHLIHSS